jgi:hypothetical protein
LRDIHFTLHTDHRNLTFLNQSGSDKVIRWKLDIQEYDCDVIYIKGAHNSIADAFSRLCPIVDEGLTTEQVVGLMMQTFRLTDEEYKMISSVHNSLEGHHGVDRTLERLRSRFPKESETWGLPT